MFLYFQTHCGAGVQFRKPSPEQGLSYPCSSGCCVAVNKLNGPVSHLTDADVTQLILMKLLLIYSRARGESSPPLAAVAYWILEGLAHVRWTFRYCT